MSKSLFHLPPTALGALAFATAGALMLSVSFGASLVIESRTDKLLSTEFERMGMNWLEVETDGLQVHLLGTAPNESARFRALNFVGTLIDTTRIRDQINVTPTSALAAPRFSVEMLRNDDGIQLIGLIPEIVQDNGMNAETLAGAVLALSPEHPPADMLQTATWPAPAGWDEALRFGVQALGFLKRAKISVAAGRVEITAIAASEPEKRRIEADLRRAKPSDVALMMEISAPRPVITPFTLRFTIDGDGASFDACSADTERARGQIQAAATAAGMEGGVNCAIGIGAPTPRWSEGASAAIRALAAMGQGAVTFSDADVTFTAGDGVTQAQFDRALGDLRAELPDVFSLEAVPPKPESAALGPVEFTATLAPEGRVELRGRLVDEPQQAAVDAFARAAFGNEQVQVRTRLDAELPNGWPIRVLAGLEALSHLEEGSLLVRSDLVEVKGITGSLDARGNITRILSSRLGQGQTFRVDVAYDEERDPLAALPTPEECAAEVTSLLKTQKISFTPGSAEIAREAAPVVEALAEILRDCPAIKMEIAGYTDSQGSEGGNKALSQARADAVLMSLLGRRVDTSGMKAIGYGEADPIADNGTEEGREANRRIEFHLIGLEPADDGEAGTPDPDSEAEAATPAPAELPRLADGSVDFSADRSPSLAPSEMTLRPKARPERAN